MLDVPMQRSHIGSRWLQANVMHPQQAWRLRRLSLHLQVGQQGLLLDIGCGTGLSGQELTAAGHAWLGCDVALSMLAVGEAGRLAALHRAKHSPAGTAGSICAAAAPAGSKQHAGAASKPGGTAAASGPQEPSCNRQAGVYSGQAGTMRPLQAFDGGVLLSDMGHGLPLRAASFDGAISISAVQWLCHAAQPELACRRFFGALRHCLKPEAAAILQVYVAGNS